MKDRLSFSSKAMTTSHHPDSFRCSLITPYPTSALTRPITNFLTPSLFQPTKCRPSRIGTEPNGPKRSRLWAQLLQFWLRNSKNLWARAPLKKGSKKKKQTQNRVKNSQRAAGHLVKEQAASQNVKTSSKSQSRAQRRSKCCANVRSRPVKKFSKSNRVSIN